MAETLISPGVFLQENDLSQITQGPITAGAAIVGAGFFKVESGDQVKSVGNSKEVRLRELKRLFDDGLIETGVYNERVNVIISERN